LGDADDVAPRKGEWHGLRLDRGRRPVVLFGKRTGKRPGKAEFIKGSQLEVSLLAKTSARSLGGTALSRVIWTPRVVWAAGRRGEENGPNSTDKASIRGFVHAARERTDLEISHPLASIWPIRGRFSSRTRSA